jgi:hypothetical protein
VKRIGLTLAICAFSATAVSAQAAMPGAAAKAAARRAADATSEHIAAEQRTGEVVKTPPKTATKAAPTPAGAPAAAKKPVEATATPAGAPKQATGLNVATLSDTGSTPTVIMREVYDYAREGRRDPFVSLLMTSELRPTMSDLKLTSIIFDPTGRHSLAVLRDIGTNAQYRVTTGSVLGRMHVASIRGNTIVFTIDEFGTNRQDSLVLGDTTKARLK